MVPGPIELFCLIPSQQSVNLKFGALQQNQPVHQS